MNSRFLYRAKRVDNGEWIVGSLFMDCDNKYHILENKRLWSVDGSVDQFRGVYDCYAHSVTPETVGQCTGLSAVKSYRGTHPEDLLIFDGDNVLLKVGNIITQDSGEIIFSYDYVGGWVIAEKNNHENTCSLGLHCHQCEIIGTIHDN